MEKGTERQDIKSEGFLMLNLGQKCEILVGVLVTEKVPNFETVS
jgi:hypothetical protein